MKVLPMTTNATVMRDLTASVAQIEAQRNGVPFGTTWGDLKAAMTVLGVQDGDRIAAIEVGCSQLRCSGLLMRSNEPDGIVIQEK